MNHRDRLAAWPIDLLCLLLASISILILATGGFQGEVGGYPVSVRSAQASLSALAVLAIFRGLLAPSTRLLYADATPLQLSVRLGERTARALERLERLPDRDVAKTILALSAAALVLRAANAWFYYGYFSGDDVEIVQMAYAAVVDRPYTAWDLRSPFFPMVFIYPPLKALHAAGVADPRILFFSGRMVVVAGSVIGVPFAYAIARTIWRSTSAGLVAALFAAGAGVTTRFSGSELPRPVAGSLVLVALHLLTSRPRRTGAALGAGAALGLAASLRFSEAVFLVPACTGLLWQKSVRSAVAVAASGLATMAAVLFTGDLLYWGDPLHSSVAIVRYTLLDGQSSRGFQPWFAYLPILLAALGPAGFGFLALGIWKHARGPLLHWSILPVVLLSFVPHKETRYLVPLMPVLAIVSAAAVWHLLTRAACRSPAGSGTAPGFRRRWVVLVALPALLAGQADLMRFRRSEDAVDAARHAARHVPLRAVAFEQSWRAGGWLYFPRGTRVIDLDTDRIGDPSVVRAAAQDPAVAYIGLREGSVRQFGYVDALAGWGFQPCAFSGKKRTSYLLFERRG